MLLPLQFVVASSQFIYFKLLNLMLFPPLSRKLLILPLDSFVRLSDSLPNEPVPHLAFAANTARCGSTMLCQMASR